MIAGATSCRTCRKPPTACGCAATGSWIRPRFEPRPARRSNLKAVPAPSPAAAAQYYPAIYWYSMLKIPAKSEFPVGKVPHQGEWLHVLKTGGCIGCHAMGTLGNAHDAQGFRPHEVSPMRGRGASSPGKPCRKWPATSTGSIRRARSPCSPTGPTASRRASCRSRSRSARRGSSATSSSRSGTGAPPPTTCTI